MNAVSPAGEAKERWSPRLDRLDPSPHLPDEQRDDGSVTTGTEDVVPPAVFLSFLLEGARARAYSSCESFCQAECCFLTFWGEIRIFWKLLCR